MTKESKQGNSVAVPEEKVAQTEKAEPPANAQSRERDYGAVKVVEDLEKNRIQIFFSAKPNEATLKFLKECGFRWSPQSRSWNQPLSNAARFVVTTLLDGLGVTA